MCCGQESQRCLDGEDKAVFDRRGCNDRGMLVQGWESLWSWFGRGVGTKRGCRRGKRKKIWSFGVQEAGSLSGHRSKRCATRSSWLFTDEELTLEGKLRTVSGFIKEGKTDVNC